MSEKHIHRYIFIIFQCSEVIRGKNKQDRVESLIGNLLTNRGEMNFAGGYDGDDVTCVRKSKISGELPIPTRIDYIINYVYVIHRCKLRCEDNAEQHMVQDLLRSFRNLGLESVELISQYYDMSGAIVSQVDIVCTVFPLRSKLSRTFVNKHTSCRRLVLTHSY